MSGRPTTRRSTRWCRLLLVLCVAAAIALPSLAAGLGARSVVDKGHATGATMSDAFDDTQAVASMARAERSSLLVVFVAGASIAWVLTPQWRRAAATRPVVRSRRGVPGGVGLRAPPAPAAV
jgi:hypothetical protein